MIRISFSFALSYYLKSLVFEYYEINFNLMSMLILINSINYLIINF